ncbi:MULTISPECIES: hypothetical protein [unclassified Bradyrhizobium]|uniref:hypothetical protein n=1 Tax=unclassified Bradyrhizobium TaxID=2631580 RepID=UPI002916C224|nr:MULTISPECIES: hypothetical protein [unclassified Bradyrhizobium]
MSTLDLEKRIADRVISDALAAGYTIDVYDGGETTLKRCYSKRQVLEAMFSTDCDVLTFRTGPGGRIGSVTFIWGNGCDVIHDWSDRAEIAAILSGANEYADQH